MDDDDLEDNFALPTYEEAMKSSMALMRQYMVRTPPNRVSV